VTASCIAFALLSAVVPVSRAFLLLEVSYNEGWNVYNAGIAARHLPLYPAPYAWTSVNYPALSFYVIAWLSRFTHDYLFTARALSLAGLAAACLLVGAVVHSLTGGKRAAVLAAFFCLALFCCDADVYVGMDDPQMFAQAFYLGGLLVYIRYRRQPAALFAAALLFVLGAGIKHNLIEFPLAVLLDLSLDSPRRALRFALWLAILGGAGLGLSVFLGGPFFFTLLLSPRELSWDHLGGNLVDVYPAIILPGLAAAWVSIKILRMPACRIIALLFWLAFAIGSFFSGGVGVWINALFGSLLAMAMLLGILFAGSAGVPAAWPRWARAWWLPALLFGWLIVPLIVSGNWWAPGAMRENRLAEARFRRQVEFLKSQPGPAICESLLRCYYAGKPYVYDPFNATRLILLGKLDAGAMAERIARHEFGAIQLNHSPAPGAKEHDLRHRFTLGLLDTINRCYIPAFQQEDCIVYLPKKGPPLAGSEEADFRSR
jgi:hypothetical protein